jgi:hypothetical protein
MANYSKIALNNVPISEEECMGDSLVTINEALLTLADGINKLDGLFGDVTNCDTTVNTISASGDFLTINVNGVPRKIRLWD